MVDLTHYGMAVAIFFLAYLVRGIAGFGSGLIAIPSLALMFPLQMVVPIVVLLDLIGSAAQGAANRQHIVWPVLVPLMPFTLIGILLALFFFQSVETRWLNLSLGIFVMAFAVYQLLPVPTLRGGVAMAFPFGLLGGLLGTLFGTGGPFYVIYLNLCNLPKDAFRASFASYFLLDGAVRMLVYIFGLNLLNRQFLLLLVFAIPPFMLGLYSGGRVQRDIPARTFRMFISLILVGCGAALVLRS